MPVDFIWQSNGGLLLDSTGDIACTPAGSIADIQSIVQSRLKSAVNGWKLYSFGADLESVIGETAQQELEATLQRAVISSLTSDGFLDAGILTVVPLLAGTSVTVLVYLQNQLFAQASVVDNPQNLPLLQAVTAR